MRIVVTGALGHIGSRLIRELPRAFPEPEIVMVDNLATQRHASLFDLPGGARYRFVEADILDADLAGLFRGAYAVVHLAAITDAAGSFAVREQVGRVNIAGTHEVAKACARVGAALVFPSTTSVYGMQAQVVDEACASLRPQSPYAESKLEAEKLLRRLGESDALRFVTCRLGTIFGTSPGMRFHTAVNKFCWQAATGQALTVWRDAFHQHRAYLDLSDAVRLICFILHRDLFDRGIYNALTLNATVAEITQAIAAQVPDLRLQFVDSPLLNQHSYRVSCERLTRAGFEFQGDLQDGIRETLRLLGTCAGREAPLASGAAS